jgi:hypothetical protein
MAESRSQPEAEVGYEMSFKSTVKVLHGTNSHDYIGGSALVTQPGCDVPILQHNAPLEIPLEGPFTFPADDYENIIGENGLELQIALDSMATGNLEPLRLHCKSNHLLFRSISGVKILQLLIPCFSG